jgi:hypothetical protein
VAWPGLCVSPSKSSEHVNIIHRPVQLAHAGLNLNHSALSAPARLGAEVIIYFLLILEFDVITLIGYYFRHLAPHGRSFYTDASASTYRINENGPIC